MDAKSGYPLVTVGGFEFYDVKTAPSDKKQRFKSAPIGGKITYRKGRELVAVDAWKRFSRLDHRAIVFLRDVARALRSGPPWRIMRWYRNSNVLALYTWLITIILVAYVARLVIYRDPNITGEEASHALEVYGTLITYIGTVWIGTGVALTSNERDTLRRLSKKRKPINTSNFDLASALLKAAKLGVEGIYIMTGGLALLALHFAYDGLHH